MQFNKIVQLLQFLPCTKVPVVDAIRWSPPEFEIRYADTTTGAVDLRILTLILKGIPERKLDGVRTTYELKSGIIQ